MAQSDAPKVLQRRPTEALPEATREGRAAQVGLFGEATLLNFRMIASAVLTTDEAVAAMGA